MQCHQRALVADAVVMRLRQQHRAWRRNWRRHPRRLGGRCRRRQRRLRRRRQLLLLLVLRVACWRRHRRRAHGQRVHVVNVPLVLVELGECGATYLRHHIRLHGIENVRIHGAVGLLEAGLDAGAQLFVQRQIGLLQELVNGRHHLADFRIVRLLLEALACKVEVEARTVDAAVLLDEALEQLGAGGLVQQLDETLVRIAQMRKIDGSRCVDGAAVGQHGGGH